MAWHDQPFKNRFHTLGDPAENVYAEVLPLGKTERFGWRRPGVAMGQMDPILRHMPDYYAQSGYMVEVMGCGADGILKSMKLSKYEALKEWVKLGKQANTLLALFVWNSHHKQWCVVSWDNLKLLVAKARRNGIASFPSDGVEYYPITWDDLIEKADLHGEHQTD